MEAYAWLASQQSQITADLVELANQNSGSGHLQGLLRVADWLEDWMDLRGTTFQRIYLPPRRVIGDDGDELAQETTPALRWDYHPERERQVLLAIHYDTVFPASSPFQTCELLSPDKLQGPGVADAKGGILVLRNALKALTAESLASDCGWSVLLTPDEEVGSPSSTALMQQMAPDFDFGLLFEPCLPTGELVGVRKGSGNFDVVVRGKAAHAGRHFHDGRNAVAMLCRLLTMIHELNGQHAGLTINVGAIRGGGPVNVVPDAAVGRVNVRVDDQHGSQWFESQLQQIVADANALDGFQIRVYGGITSPPKSLTAETRQLMLAVENSMLAIGEPPVVWKATGGVCDGNKLAAAGLPNIDTLGPIGDGLHSHAEWVQPSSIVRRAKAVVNLLHRFSTGEFAELARTRESL